MSTLSQFSGGVPLWVSGQPVRQYSPVRSPADGQQYVRMTATGSGATDPSADPTNYRPDGGRAIKSTQRGAIFLSGVQSSNTATITSVNTAKTQLRFLGINTTATTNDGGSCNVDLTNATTITATRSVAAGVCSVGWELTEYA